LQQTSSFYYSFGFEARTPTAGHFNCRRMNVQPGVRRKTRADTSYVGNAAASQQLRKFNFAGTFWPKRNLASSLFHDTDDSTHQ
jgi:hypothetical protein